MVVSESHMGTRLSGCLTGLECFELRGRHHSGGEGG